MYVLFLQFWVFTTWMSPWAKFEHMHYYYVLLTKGETKAQFVAYFDGLSSTLVIIVSSVYFIFRSIYIHIFGSVFCVCVLIIVSMWRCVWVIYRTIWMENVSYEFEIDRMTTMLKQSENHNEKLAHKNEFKSHTHRRRGHMTHRLIWLLTHHRTITSMCTCVRVLLLLLFLFHRKNSE